MKMHRHLAVLGIVLFACFGLAGCSGRSGVEAAREDGKAPTVVDTAAEDFMTKSTQANLAEIAMAGVAIRRSDNTDVQDYANMIRSDDTKSLEELTDLMMSKNVLQPNALPVETQSEIVRMEALTGGEFNREFINAMVADHRKSVERLRDRSAIGTDPDLSRYVEHTLPKAEMHLDKAQRLQSKLFRHKHKNAG